MNDNNDYKHIIQDTTNVYIGGRLTYDEIMEAEDAPFKLKTIILHHILPEIDSNTTLENHLFFLNKNSSTYRIFNKLKVKFSLNVFYEDGHGKNKPGYHIDEFSIDEILDNEDIMANKDTIFLTELKISKLRMMSIPT